MRNLLGRLHARPPADLDRIAAFWGVPMGTAGRHANVAALYRVMIDPVAARDVWARLSPDEAAMVRLLAAGDPAAQPPTLAELARSLAVVEPAARETAVRLYRAGILAREGDDEELPVGESPRIFMPRELSLLFRRVLDEVDLGDRSTAPLRVLVEWLDDGELDEAAEAWGVVAVPGVRNRDEIGRRLLRQVAEPGRLARVVARLDPDSRRIWELARSSLRGSPLPLADAAGLLGDGDGGPRAAARLRHALGRLERSLLVWHTYGPGGFRGLFVPAEVHDSPPAASRPSPPLAPLPPDAIPSPPPRPPFALAWDLLTILRDVVGNPWPVAAPPSKHRLREVNRHLWHAGAELPPAGYPSFLLSLAAAEGLVEADGEPAAWRATGAARRWPTKSFGEQSERLRTRWLDDETWSEGAGLDEVEVWGVDWRRVRRRLLDALADPDLGVQPGRWYPLDRLSERVAAEEPDLLGRSFTAATARMAGEAGVGTDEDEARSNAVAEVVSVELRTALCWFGEVDVAETAETGRAVRLVAPGPLSGGMATDSGGDRPELAVAAEGSITLLRPSPAAVWALGAFADLETLRPNARYRLSAASLRRALEAGHDVARVVAVLERRSGAKLPPAVGRELQGWARAVRRVRLAEAFLLEPDDPAEVDGLIALAAARGWEALPLPTGGVLVRTRAERGSAAAESLAEALRREGYTAVEAGSPGSQRRARGS